ncbi:MAG: permease prefix domain 1-containing protein, partial [Vicinamibacterales bacterium]
MLERWIATVRGLLSRRRVEGEIDEELAFHLDREAEANVARGMSPDQARRAARRSIGGLAQATEGRVAVDGEAVSEPHAAIGMVFQEESTFPWRT